MNNLYRFLIIAALFNLLPCISASSGEEKELIEVVATGIGKDSENALKNALRAAIEQAVGTLVDSETLAKNDEVVNDQILSYSAGFVESHKVIGEPKTSDGLVSIKINAQVRRTQLTQKLQAANIHIKEVDGESFFGEVITKMEQQQSANDMINKALDGFPENCIVAKIIGKPDYNDINGKLILQMEVSVDTEVYNNFTQNLLSVLDKTASKKNKVVSPCTPGQDALVASKMDYHEIRESSIAVCRQINEARTNSSWEIFYYPTELVCSVMNKLNVPVATVEIVDASSGVVASGRYDIPKLFSATGINGVPILQIAPIFIAGRNQYAMGGESNPGYFTPGESRVTYKIAFDVSPNEIKKMKNIVVNVDKGMLLSENPGYNNVIR